MLIIADENIPYVREAFSPLGEIRVLAGRSISRADVNDADILLVRSVTRVNEQLLAGSRVRFVGTATAGIDHIDTDWLRSAGIAFASAQGSNAESVAEYIAAALAALRPRIGGTLRSKSIGIVGAGHCGSRVERIARALGMKPSRCDPPLARATFDAKYLPLADLKDVDVLTLHTPLTLSGTDRTAGMIDADFLNSMKPGAIFINAARGGIADEKALIAAIDSRRFSGAVIDAWESEPNFSVELMRRVNIATPHIAGYSLDGKIRGTEMIYAALCNFLGIRVSWRASDVLPPTVATFELNTSGGEDELVRLILEAYPILRDDAALRRPDGLVPAERAVHFDRLRRDYPVRREFQATRVVTSDPNGPIARAAAQIGFTISEKITMGNAKKEA